MQQTRIEQGINYYNRFIEHYPKIEDLASADEIAILNDWQGLGYYSRARNLHFSAKYIVNELNGIFPTSYDEIIKLKGVGKYTAAAVASFAYNEKKAVVDGNVYRFLSRAFNISTPIDSGVGRNEFQAIADKLISEVDPATHNQAMMEMGSCVCSPQPNCSVCPVQMKCLAFENGSIQDLPVKLKKTKVRDRHFHFLIYSEGTKTIVEHRTKKDIWQNMYQFPLIELKNEDDPICVDLSHQHLESKPVKHILSHQHIYATFHHINKFPPTLQKSWIIIQRAQIQDYPLPRVIDRYLEKTSNT